MSIQPALDHNGFNVNEDKFDLELVVIASPPDRDYFFLNTRNDNEGGVRCFDDRARKIVGREAVTGAPIFGDYDNMCTRPPKHTPVVCTVVRNGSRWKATAWAWKRDYDAAPVIETNDYVAECTQPSEETAEVTNVAQ